MMIGLHGDSRSREAQRNAVSSASETRRIVMHLCYGLKCSPGPLHRSRGPQRNMAILINLKSAIYVSVLKVQDLQCYAHALVGPIVVQSLLLPSPTSPAIIHLPFSPNVSLARPSPLFELSSLHPSCSSLHSCRLLWLPVLLDARTAEVGGHALGGIQCSGTLQQEHQKGFAHSFARYDWVNVWERACRCGPHDN